MHAKSCLFALLLVAASSDGALAQKLEFVYEDADLLPEVRIEGKTSKIHTQGLFVTNDHYLVTGRLETTPKRALLLRFARKRSGMYEFVDITPNAEALPSGIRLDHPGGFDVDAKGDLHVPISTSDSLGPSLVYRFRIAADEPLATLESKLAFKVDDHIGAICCNRANNTLFGANWDTNQVYHWTREGKLISKRNRSNLFPKAPEWQLAVQDWKGLPESNGIILAGGIDKSGAPATGFSKAVIQFLDLSRGRVMSSHRLPELENVSRPVSNEGLCWFKEKLYLLPEDLGRGAKVLRYSRRKRIE